MKLFFLLTDHHELQPIQMVVTNSTPSTSTASAAPRKNRRRTSKKVTGSSSSPHADTDEPMNQLEPVTDTLPPAIEENDVDDEIMIDVNETSIFNASAASPLARCAGGGNADF